jgi:hypothetical protein
MEYNKDIREGFRLLKKASPSWGGESICLILKKRLRGLIPNVPAPKFPAAGTGTVKPVKSITAVMFLFAKLTRLRWKL